MLTIRSQQNFWAGLFFLGCGVFELVLSMQYDFGSPENMGPSFMPGLLSGIGLVVLASSSSPTGSPRRAPPSNPVIGGRLSALSPRSCCSRC